MKSNKMNTQYREQISYNPFGEVRDRLYCTDNTTPDARLKYIGKQFDYEMNLADHGVRKYDNILGQFTSIDPMWEKYYGWTPYHYCGYNPLMAVDPSGKFEKNKDGSAKIRTDKKGEKYVTADNGKKYTMNEDVRTNCAGYALLFCNGEGYKKYDADRCDTYYFFDPELVPKAAKDDGYSEPKDIKESTVLQPGDLLIYINQNGKCVHASVFVGYFMGFAMVTELQGPEIPESEIVTLELSKERQNGGTKGIDATRVEIQSVQYMRKQ